MCVCITLKNQYLMLNFRNSDISHYFMFYILQYGVNKETLLIVFILQSMIYMSLEHFHLFYKAMEKQNILI